MNHKKAIADMLVGLMLLSGLTVFAGSSSAEIINKPNDFDVRISWTNLDDYTRYRAEDVTFDVEIENDGSEDIYHCNLSINTQIHDENGNSVSSPFIWHQQDVNDDATIWGWWGSHTFHGFSATIKSNAEYGRYNITAHLDFQNSTGAHFYYEGYILFDIGPRMQIYTYGGANVYPGEIKHDLELGLYTRETVHDVYWNLSAPDSDFEFVGDNPSTGSAYRGDLYAYNWWHQDFIFNVTKDKAPNMYAFQWTAEYSVNGVRVSEQGSVNITVNKFGTIEMSANVFEINRGTSTMNITFSFTNTGNVNLKDLEIKLDSVSTAYFTIPQDVDRYEGNTPIYENEWTSIGNAGKGETITQTIKLIIDSHLPAGRHKVLFDFKAEYENGTVQSYWSWESSPLDGSSAHYVPQWRSWDYSWSYYPDDSRTLHEGAYVIVDVVGDVFDMEITPSVGVSSSSASLIREDNMLSMEVQNNEYRNYRDLSFSISTGADSPFMNPADENAQWSEPYNVSYLNGNSVSQISLHVKTRPGVAAGYYDVPVKIRATDITSSNTVENTVTTRILITGAGAKPVITAVSTEKISPGKTFTVTVTVENNGDDVAKNLMIKLAVQNSLEGSDIALVSGPPKVDALNPGESTTVEFTFVASSSLKSSQTYPISAEISYENMYRGDSATQTQQIGVQSAAQQPKGVGTMDVLVWLLIILVILAIIGAIMLIAKDLRKKGREELPMAPETAEQPEETAPSPPETPEEGEEF